MDQKLNAAPVWRSMLFVPVNVPRFVAKAHLRGADGIILDLEDSIAPAEKAAARGLVAAAAANCARGGADILVRVNRPLELAVRDLEAVVSPAVTALLLPKIDSASHVRLLAELVEELEARRGMAHGHTRFIVMVETAAAFPRIWEIAAAHPRNVGLNLGSEDFALSTDSQPEAEVMLYPMQQAVIAASAAGISPFGTIGTVADYKNLDAYRETIRRSRRFGFHGASCIHPDIVPLLNEGFSPGAAELAGARRVIAAYARAQAEGRGSIEVDGKMIDVPVVERAQRLVSMAKRIEERKKRVKPA